MVAKTVKNPPCLHCILSAAVVKFLKSHPKTTQVDILNAIMQLEDEISDTILRQAMKDAGYKLIEPGMASTTKH